MAKLSAKYEAMVVFSIKNGEDNVKALVEKFKSLIESNGTLEEANEWGKRKLAYEINDETEAIMFSIHLNPADSLLSLRE